MRFVRAIRQEGKEVKEKSWNGRKPEGGFLEAKSESEHGPLGNCKRRLTLVGEGVARASEPGWVS